MNPVDIILSDPPRMWQRACVEHLVQAGAATRLRRAPPRIIGGAERLTRRSRMLQPTIMPVADRSIVPARLTIDLDGASGSGSAWRLIQGDGRPLSAFLPFAREWHRPGQLGSVMLVDDRNRVLQSATVAVAGGRSYGRTLDEILVAAAHLPMLAWRALQAGRDPGNTSQPPTAVPAPKAALCLALARGGLGRLWRRMADMAVVELWQVGVADRPIHTFLSDLDLSKARWLTKFEPSAYCADPFANPRDPDEVWWERYDYRTGLGTLERHCLGGPVLPVSLDVGGHQSFPYMADMDGEVVLIPETHASGTTRVYRLDAESRPRCIAVLPVAGIDATSFRWGELYWISLTDGSISDNANLCLWHAPAPEGPWTPHQGNPVKLDVRSSRNAGTPFQHDGVLYRPAMDCSRTYGGQIMLHRVHECTPTAYSEEPVAVVRPDPGWLVNHGLHTLSAWGERTLIDAKFRGFQARGFAAKVMHRLGL